MPPKGQKQARLSFGAAAAPAPKAPAPKSQQTAPKTAKQLGEAPPLTPAELALKVSSFGTLDKFCQAIRVRVADLVHVAGHKDGWKPSSRSFAR